MHTALFFRRHLLTLVVSTTVSVGCASSPPASRRAAEAETPRELHHGGKTSAPASTAGPPSTSELSGPIADLRASFARLETYLGSPVDDAKAARASSDAATVKAIEGDLATARAALDTLLRLAARPGASANLGNLVGDAQRKLGPWERAIKTAVADRQVEADIRQHLVVDHGAFTPEDSSSPSRIAEAFAALGRDHLLETTAAFPNEQCPLWRFVPQGHLGGRPCAKSAPAIQYFWRQGGGPNVVDFEPYVQEELPEGTPVLAWNLLGKDQFVAVTPDGGRYLASLVIRRNNLRTAVVERGGRLDGYVPLRTVGITYQDLSAGAGDVSPSTRAKMEAAKSVALRCHDAIDTRYGAKLEKLESLHEDLVRRGTVARSVWDQITTLRDERAAAHETGCKREESEVVAVTSMAQAEYVAARKKCWERVSAERGR